MIEIVYDGRQFDSLKALYAEHAARGITYACFMGRIKGGWDMAKALSEPQHKNTRRSFLVDGKVFPTLKALATAAGISYEAAVKRCHRGFSDHEIFHGRAEDKPGKPAPEPEPAKPGRRGSPVIIDGLEYPNILAAHEALRPTVSINTARARLRYGWSAEEALGIKYRVDGRSVSHSGALRKPRVRAPKQTYEVDGKSFQSIAELAKEYRLSSALVYNRIRISGWSAERAVKEPVAEQVEVGGVVYRSALAAWQRIGKTSFPLYNARRTQGLPLEVCLGLAPLPPLQRYEVNGRVYATLADVADFYKLTVGQLQSRLQSMSLEDAITYTPSNGRYTLKRFEEDPELARTMGSFYFIKIASSGGMLHKVGITQRPVEARFQSQQFVLLAEFKGELEKLFTVEQAILKLFKKNLFRGDEDFEGRTETFILLEEEEAAMLAEIKRRFRPKGTA